MRIFLNFLIFMLVAIAQVTILKNLAIFEVIPNLALVLVVLWSILIPREGFFCALFLGLILDLNSAAPFGTFLLTFLIISFLCQLVAEEIFGVVNFFLATLIVGISSLIFSSVYFLILEFQSINLDFLKFFLKIATFELVYNLVLCVVFFFIISKYNKCFSDKGEKVLC